MPDEHCDYCSSPVYDRKDMGAYVSKVCERHFWKNREMETEEESDA